MFRTFSFMKVNALCNTFSNKSIQSTNWQYYIMTILIFCNSIVILLVLFLTLLTSGDRAERGMWKNPHVRKSSLH